MELVGLDFAGHLEGVCNNRVSVGCGRELSEIEAGKLQREQERWTVSFHRAERQQDSEIFTLRGRVLDEDQMKFGKSVWTNLILRNCKVGPTVPFL